MNDISGAPETSRHAPSSGVQTVPLPRGFSELTVSNGAGEIAVTVVDRPDIRVTWTRIGDRLAPATESTVAVNVEGGRIHIHPERATSGPISIEADLSGLDALIDGAARLVGMAASSVLSALESFEIQVEIPAAASGVAVRINAGSAEVRLDGLRGPVDVKTASGEIVAMRCVGGISVATASGDVRLDGINGAVQIRSASGDTIVRGAASPIRIETVSGDIDAAIVPGRDGGALRTVSGDVRLALPAERLPVGGEVTLQTVSGSARTDDGFVRTDRRAWTIDGGGPMRFVIQTVSGDVALRRTSIQDAAPGVAAPPEPRRAPEPPVTRADVRAAPASPVGPATNGNISPTPSEPTAAPTLPAPAVVQATGDIAEAPTARRRLLEAVERGDLDIEEALRLLDDSGAAG
ncbi:MAG: DUF4097 family beta strand repeat protein [Thermomicrobiales bacterium]|nr:DUF4097 family beta strand repeat protein [Thermomicrobiales bacterium]